MTSNDYQVGGNHYKSQPYQHWDFVMDTELPYMEAQVVRYVSRWRRKDGLKDLLKAKHFAEKMYESFTSLPGIYSTTTPSTVAERTTRFIETNGISNNHEQVIIRMITQFAHSNPQDRNRLLQVREHIEHLIAEARAAEPGPGYVNQG